VTTGGETGDRTEGDGGPHAAADALREEATLRAGSWLSWVWLVPVIAACVVLWLAWRSLEQRGPQITIALADAGALQPGQTPVRYKGVNVGIVESVELTADASKVLVRARMTRAIEPYLATGARFWIVQPRVGAQGISGLATLVSGSYIEMYPGRGESQRSFTGLAEPPILQPDTAGTFFTLLAPDVSSLIPGAPITYRGIDVGEIEGSSLAPSQTQVEIYAFVRAPYDHLVHPQTRFWNVAGIDVVAGPQGVQVRVSSWQQLLAGGVAFDTPARSLSGPPAPFDSRFQLYDSRSEAFRYPQGKPLLYRVEFAENARGLLKGTPVELEGTGIGEVTDSSLLYDRRRGSLYTLATVAIDPTALDIPGIPQTATAEQADAVEAALEHLVAGGLRARLVSSSLLTGSKVIALDMLTEVPPARVREVAGVAELPTAPAADIDEILQSLENTAHHIDRATAGPQLTHALTQLDSALTHLNQLSVALGPQAQSLIASLRATSAAAQRTADAAGAVLGANGSQSVDLPRLMRQLDDAARSIQELADYLDRHPEALIRGRTQ
jgi:paraquat-inducible protein B